MNDNNELDALLATIENGLDECNLAADGQTADSNYRKSALEALATLREKLATLEAEREALLKALFPFAGIYEDYEVDCEQGYKRSFSRWFYDGTTHDDTEAFSNAFETYTALRKQS